jgi:hypothetical protein
MPQLRQSAEGVVNLVRACLGFESKCGVIVWFAIFAVSPLGIVRLVAMACSLRRMSTPLNALYYRAALIHSAYQ